MIVALLGTFFGATLIVSVLVSKRPLALARAAVLSVGRPVTLRLPPRAAALVLRPAEHTADYRAAPDRRLALAALPGEERVLREDHVVRFVPDENWMLVTHRGWRKSTLVRVDVTASADSLTLRCRRLPVEVPLLIVAMLLIARAIEGGPRHLGAVAFLPLYVWIGVMGELRRAKACADASIAELAARIASANGEAPEPQARKERPVNEKGEWLCACGMANEPTRTTCRRCWAHRDAPR